MIILHHNGVTIPHRRVEIYGSFMRVLMGEWDEIKSLAAGTANANIDKNIMFFQRICLFLLDIDQQFKAIDLGASDVVAFVESQLRDIFRSEAPPAVFMDNIAARSGLLYKTGESKYEFTNRGFFEFLLARELAESLNFKIIAQHINEGDWFEINALFVALLPDVTNFIHYLNAQITSKSTLYHRLLARSMTDAVSVDSQLRRTIEQELVDIGLNYLRSEANDPDLLKDIYKVDRQYWQKLFMNVLEGVNGSYLPTTVVRAMAQMDDVELLLSLGANCLQMDAFAQEAVAEALGGNTLSDSIRVLWLLAGVENAKVVDAAMRSLCQKGDKVIDSCKQILDDSLQPRKKET